MKTTSSQGLAVHAAKERKESREPVERVSSRASIFRTASADCLPSRRRLKARCSVDSGSSRTAIGGGNFAALSTHSSVSQRTGAKGGLPPFQRAPGNGRTRRKAAIRDDGPETTAGEGSR